MMLKVPTHHALSLELLFSVNQDIFSMAFK